MMAFRKNLCVSIKCGGKILREEGEFVSIPFYSEYSVLLKNLHTRKALINIDIDGASVFKNLVINPNQTVELERFQDKPNKFKFIEKTQQISDHRGDRVDDGFVRVEFRFEKELPIYVPQIPITWPFEEITYGPNYGDYGRNVWRGTASYNCNSRSMIGAKSAPTPITRCAVVQTISGETLDGMACDAGITTVGSKSNQKIGYASIGDLDPNKEVIIIRLRGKRNNIPVQAPITTATKFQCAVCGKWYKIGKGNWCRGCGTYLG